jgi:hypothetical protein
MGQESRTTRAKHRRRTRRLRRQRGGNQNIETWIGKLKETFPGIYGSKTQDESYELVSLKNDNLTISETVDGDMSRLDRNAFAENTKFYNVAKDVYISLQDVLVPGLKPKEFREHINAIKQPSQSNDPQAVMISQLLTFLEEVEKAMRFAARVEPADLPDVLTNEQAYPLFIWAIGMNITVNENDQGVPVLFALSQQSGQPVVDEKQQSMPDPQV